MSVEKDLLTGRPRTNGGSPTELPEEPAAEMLARLKTNGAELDAKHFDPLVYQIPKLVPEGLGMLVAPPKKGKSFLVLDFGLSVADGTKALCSIPVTKHPVLYLALEDGERRLQERSRLLLEGDSIPPGIDFVTRAKPAEAYMMIEAFMTEHRDENPFVILDTFAKVKRQKRPGEESYLVDYEAGERLKKLTELAPGSTLLVVHHSRKAEATDFIDAASGTYGLAGSFDFVMVLNRKRLEDNAVLAITGRDVIEAEYALTAEGGYMWKLDGGDLRQAAQMVTQRRTEEKMGDRKYEVFQHVCGLSEPTTAVDVAKALGLDGNDAGTYLRRLVADGALTKAGRGKYMRSNVVPIK
jgi:RecA-family ATPase